jgi:hypothetical protein
MFNPSNNKNHIVPKNEHFDFKRGTGQGDFLRLFQDPTVLGFKMFFLNIVEAKNQVDTPIIDTAPTINSTGLFGNESNVNSAMYYLNSIGDNARVAMLKDFKSLLSKLNSEYPWYFQSIAGLDDAWKRDYLKPKFKKEITITCLESIDLRVTALMDLYRKVAYDWDNRRAILPDNLRKFDMSIKVYDNRNILRDPRKYLNKEGRTYQNVNVNEEFLGADFSETTQVTFNLSHCEFMPDDSSSVFSGISNIGAESAAQTIKIGYENIKEDNIYRTLVSLGNSSAHYHVRDYLRKELVFLANYDEQYWKKLESNTMISSPGANNPNWGDFVGEITDDVKSRITDIKEGIENVFDKNTRMTKEELKQELEKRAFDAAQKARQELGTLVEDIGTNISAAAAGAVETRLNSLFLGNVNGFSPRTLAETARNKVATSPGNTLGNALE